ncbi:MAG: GTPase Era [Armatimonadetes bacterium]|nr:GTPase Era [Armatimonadota bacterium]MDW8121995.1 GTPase Era [Armatimonadota bacterium]
MPDLIPETALPEGFRSGFVILWGRPNVGKSTLLNALVGEKTAIVSPKPQTTRNRIVGVVERPNAQIILVDTPGVHQPRHQLGEYLVAEAKRSLNDADIVLFVADATQPPTDEDRLAVQILFQVFPKAPPDAFAVLNKKDQIPSETLRQREKEFGSLGPFQRVLTISALYGDGLDELVATIIDSLPEGPPYYPLGTVTDQPEKFLIAERVREAVLHYTRDEVPHSVAVLVDSLEETRSHLLSIRATIFVEKESQKAILIGQGGQMLKKIGTMAREEVERWFGRKVFLQLWVKVAHNWRKDSGALARLGYRIPKGDLQ